MSMPSIVNFDISFIKRTSENLKQYKKCGGQYEFTMLLNSLLGLIVVPNEMNEEREFTFDFLNQKIPSFPELMELFNGNTTLLLKENKEVTQRRFYWLSKNNNERSVEDLTVGELLNRMRNGIAHFGIIPLACPENSDEWCGVIIRNFREDKEDDGTIKKNMNFETCMMQNEIRTFAEFISQKYIKTTKNRRL